MVTFVTVIVDLENCTMHISKCIDQRTFRQICNASKQRTFDIPLETMARTYALFFMRIYKYFIQIACRFSLLFQPVQDIRPRNEYIFECDSGMKTFSFWTKKKKRRSPIAKTPAYLFIYFYTFQHFFLFFPSTRRVDYSNDAIDTSPVEE